MREHATEDDMLAARAADFKALMDEHRAALAALPGVDPLPALPTAAQLQRYDAQHVERRRQLMVLCTNYQRRSREIVALHQAEEDDLRERTHAAVKSPPVMAAHA